VSDGNSRKVSGLDTGFEPSSKTPRKRGVDVSTDAKSGASSDADVLLDLWAMLTNDQKAEVLSLARRLADQSPQTTKGGAQ
jgi:hypothetical protein